MREKKSERKRGQRDEEDQSLRTPETGSKWLGWSGGGGGTDSLGLGTHSGICPPPPPDFGILTASDFND